MAEWAERCLDQGGLVVMPHAPDPQLERAADIVLGLVDAIEMMNFNPLVRRTTDQPLWPRRLVPLPQPRLPRPARRRLGQDVRRTLLGGLRTYAHLGERELTYDAGWMPSGPATRSSRSGRSSPSTWKACSRAAGSSCRPAAARDVSWKVESVGPPHRASKSSPAAWSRKT